jgi:uroporphyrinogen III methyltransferase/synthase
VLYDYLVNPRILDHAPADAERIGLGDSGRNRRWTQAEIEAAMLAAARAGKTVVRLKGGDPAVFARGAEETQTLARHGIPYEIVPGITAAVAAGSCAGVPLTHREFASAAAFITGQEIESKDSAPLDYTGLARFPGTLVFYMGRTTAPRWSQALIAAGLAGDTPAAIVARCSLPDQVTLRCTLDDVARVLRSPAVSSPVIVIVGRVAALDAAPSWFERRPLYGQTVLVTRSASQAHELVELLEEQGANVLVQAAIEILPPRDWTAVDMTLARLDTFDWVVFSSVNGVRSWLSRLEATGRDARALGPTRLAAIGPATADALADFHLRADLQPRRYQAEDLADELVRRAAGQRFLLVRASRGREILAERLVAAGGQVEQVVAYQSVDVAAAAADVVERLRAGRIDWTTVTSSAIARSLWRLFGDDLRHTQLASLSPVTSATLRDLGLEPTAEAPSATLEGLVAAIGGPHR